MNAVNPTATQSLGIATKRYLETAEIEGSLAKTHIAGRAMLLGTALFGIAEVVARLAFYCFGQVGALLTLYQSEPINTFLKEQVKAGFTATVITSASFFSLLSPTIFTKMGLPEEILPVRQYELIDRAAEERQREAQMVADIVRLPFQLMALTFQLPFYCIYLSFQLMLLPLRIAMIPLQLALCPFTFFAPRHNFRLDLL